MVRAYILSLALVLWQATPVSALQFTKDTGCTLLQGLKVYYDLDEASGTRADGWNDFDIDTDGTLETSLNGYWTLDEDSGTREDETGTSDLTDNATVTFAAGTRVQAGQFTEANSEYLSIADNASLSAGDIDFAIALWVYLDSLPPAAGDNLHSFVTKGDANSNSTFEYSLEAETAAGPTTKFRFLISDGSSTAIVRSDTFGSPSTGTWYFVMAYHDATANEIGISVNDGIVDTTSTSIGCQDTAEAFYIGGREVGAGFDSYMDGRIDEVGFWKKVLSAQEITDLYNAGAGNSYTRAVDLTDNATVTQAVGQVGNAADFTSANSEYLSASTVTPLESGDFDFSMAGWVDVDTIAATMTLFSKYGAGTSTQEYLMQFLDTGDLFRWGVRETTGNGGALTTASDPTARSTDTFYFIAVTYDASADEVSISVDDGTVTTTTGAAAPGATVTDFCLGCHNFAGPGSFLDGQLDEWGLWKKELSATEITDLYNGGSGSTLEAGTCSTILTGPVIHTTGAY